MYTNTLYTHDIDTELFAHEERNSPFALYHGETVETYAPTYSRHVDITDLDKLIIAQLNVYRILTFVLIYQVLKQNVSQDISETTIKNRLQALTDAQFLTRTDFLTATGKCALRCYSVGYRGRGLLKAMSINQRLTGYISSLENDPVRIKKILSANQYLIRSGISVNKINVCQAVLSKSRFGNKPKCIFRPQAIVFDDCITHIIESVRNNENWDTDILDKLDRMALVFRGKEHNIELKNPEVLLVAENKLHMKRVMNLVNERRYLFPISFTCDSLTYAEPESCICRSVNDKKYRSFFKKVVGL